MKTNIFELAVLELKREGNLGKKNWVDLFFKRIDTIGKYLSESNRKKEVKI